MAKKKKEASKNYLELRPCRKEELEWSVNEEGKIALHVENKGFFNRFAQKTFRKPKVSYIHLDSFGSFLWPLLDGEKTIIELGEKVEAHFGEEASPLYERLAKFFQILDSYHFIDMK